MSDRKISKTVSVVASVLLLSLPLNGCAVIGLVRNVSDLIQVTTTVVNIAQVLIDRIRETQQTQKEIKEQFDSSLDVLIKMSNDKNLPAYDKYKTFKAEYEKCLAAAQNLQEKIQIVEHWGNQMFTEWEVELSQYKDTKLAANSKKIFKSAKNRYHNLIKVMKNSQRSMDSVLDAFADRVLLLKHISNSQIIGSLETKDLVIVKGNVNSLIIKMNSSIAEADRFVKSLPQR